MLPAPCFKSRGCGDGFGPVKYQQGTCENRCSCTPLKKNCLNMYSIFLKTANKNQFSCSHRQNLVPFKRGELVAGHVLCPQAMPLDSGYDEAAWCCMFQQGSGGQLSLAEGEQRLCGCSALILLQFSPQMREGPQQKHSGWNWCAEPLVSKAQG